MTWNFRVVYYNLLAWLVLGVAVSKICWWSKSIKTYRHQYKLQLHDQLLGLSKQFLCSRLMEEDKKKQYFYIFLFWPNWTHVLADSQSAWSQKHANILGSFTIWIFTLSLEGVLPYISHNKGMCCPKGDGFAPFWSENWYRLCPFWSGIGYGFQGNYWSGWMHCSFQFQMSRKERERFYIYVFFVAALI